MVVEEVLDRTADLQRGARAYTKRELYDRAAEYLEEAVTLLEPTLQAQLRDADAGGTSARLGAALADVYGMLGGVYRRLDRLEDALHYYSSGSVLEQDPALGLVNSYSLTNRHVIAFLLAPETEEPDRTAIEDARAIVRAQAEGPRRDDWWAWADVGILSVLLGDPAAAEQAYRMFSRLGARATDFDSAASVLDEIVLRAAGHNDAAVRCAKTMRELLAEMRPR